MGQLASAGTAAPLGWRTVRSATSSGSDQSGSALHSPGAHVPLAASAKGGKPQSPVRFFSG